MAGRRTYGSYNDGCAAAHALDLVGERWTMIVVRELLLGPKRFSDVQRDVLGIGPAVLTQRLQELEAHGILQRRQLQVPGRPDVYELTAWGRRLEDVNAALSMWAVASPELPLEADMSPDTVVLAMRAHARPVAGYRRERRVALTLTDSRRDGSEPVGYLAVMSDAGTTVERVPETGEAEARVEATTRAWQACITGGVPLEELADARVEGDREVVARLVGAVSLA